MRTVLLASTLAFAVQAQQDPLALLSRVRARIGDTLDRLPRYMCTETIDRNLYEPAVGAARIADACGEPASRTATRLTTSDRLRLDVATAAAVQGEMYSWVGEGRFDDRDLMEMIHEGAISNGSFASALITIFRTEEASFTYNGDKIENGRTLVEYGFRVPYEKSHYRYGNRDGRRWVITGYGGSFLVDAESIDLVRLDVSTDRLPAETGACYASTSLDYARVQLKGVEFLLPSESRLRILQLDGAASENRTVFSGCHEFLGESAITFDPPPGGSVPAGRRGSAPPFAIPSGLAFRLALTQAINTATAAVGDPVKAKLITPIAISSKAAVPAGATVAARIVRIRQFYGSKPSVSLGIRLETVEVGGSAIRFNARRDVGLTVRKSKSGALQPRVDLGVLKGLEDGAATFEFRNSHSPYVIPAGLESKWVTAEPGAGAP